MSIKIPDNTVNVVIKENDPDEGIAAAYAVKPRSDFAYHTLLGEKMYTYVTCSPNIDIGYAITTMSKFSTKLSTLYYSYLNDVA